MAAKWDIQLLEAGDSCTKLVLGDKTGPMVNGTFRSVLGRIDPAVFFQANRSQAINLDHLADVESGLVAVISAELTTDTEKLHRLAGGSLC